jgi:hypothetical protein
LLTDGQVGNPGDVIHLSKHKADIARVFSFGIGSGADEHLVRETARSGRGKSYMVTDGESDLNSNVIQAL